MGYEVLDADGGASAAGSSPFPPPDVVALDELPPPPSEPGRPARPPRAPRGSRRGRRPVDWQRPTPEQVRGLGQRLRHASKLTWVLVAASALVGVGAGSWWTDRHGDQVRAAQLRAAVQAYVTATEVNPLVTGRGTVADYTVQVVNLGQLPLTIAVSPDDARATPTDPVVTMLTGEPAVAAGQEGKAKLRVPLDCTSDQPVPLRLTLTSADGTDHQVSVRDGNTLGQGITPRDLCSFTQGQQVLDVQLSGTLDKPELDFRNNGEQPLVVTLDSGSPLTQTSSELISLSTVPQLPVIVRPHDTTSVQLRIVVSSCRNDISDMSTLGGYGYLGFQGEVQGHTGASNGEGETNAGVDASPLVGAAMARACQRPRG
ncbi:hypothetical protein GCM10027446_18590 [Angustibacter peucedani]